MYNTDTAKRKLLPDKIEHFWFQIIIVVAFSTVLIFIHTVPRTVPRFATIPY